MLWLLIIGLAWALLALPLALAIGRGIRIADGHAADANQLGAVPDFIPADVIASVSARRSS
jgi:hypothetical protein